MKKLIKYLSLVGIGAIALNSCSDDDIIQLDPQNYSTPKITTTASTAELSEETQVETAFNFEWSAADYGVTTPPKYDIEVIAENGSFDNAKILGSTQDLAYAVSGKDLNSFVVESLGLVPNVETTINYRIVSYLGTHKAEKLFSETKSITLTPFSTDLSTPWGLVGGATVNGWNGPDVQFWKTTTPGVLEAYANLSPDSDGKMEFKIRKNNEWVEDFGGTVTATTDNGFSGTLAAGGSNIVAPKAGNYKITIDLNNLTFTAVLFQWGIVGDATPNGWDGPDAQVLSFDGTKEIWYFNGAVLKDGEIKFRQNDKWEIDYGQGATPGTLIEKTGSNIPVKAGTYDVIMDLKNLTYTLTPVQ
ncbi:SusE domain-containing protein [Faecalibacter rhinopitheci]|uniref:SusE domain-containing protein n=1 Tax=Faecalibacter rhinopitheci TaxID=2779678 RepID=A0A8J7FRZ4_9FLAO|nr:SusE domain-containing protein [Faecalibacter rhinopitheci]MBF0597553.1 SusE domain-containing protein [Faecalibacter rhinopitheci]MBQ0147316.1 SusE domain-containing protein [Candidatus Onthonaster equi]